MKKITIIIASLLLFYSCSNNNDDLPNLASELISIDEITAPESFTFGERDTIKLKYSLIDNCSYFDNIYYEYQDTTRIVAIRTIKDLDSNCDQTTTQYDYNLIVNATQEEDYLFKFYKGKDSNGDNIFEEVIVPVN